MHNAKSYHDIFVISCTHIRLGINLKAPISVATSAMQKPYIMQILTMTIISETQIRLSDDLKLQMKDSYNMKSSIMQNLTIAAFII